MREKLIGNRRFFFKIFGIGIFNLIFFRPIKSLAQMYNMVLHWRRSTFLFACGNVTQILGLNSNSGFTLISSPISVGGINVWESVAAGNSTALALKRDGTLWSMAASSVTPEAGTGALPATSRSSPVQVGTLTNWSKVVMGSGYALALKRDGTIWSWGTPTNGVTGLNINVTYSSPVQIGTLTGWTDVAAGWTHAGGIQAGKLFMWGEGGNGRLGSGSASTRSSPVQIGTLTDWSALSLGYDHSMALKTDNSVWAWGVGTTGALGNNNNVNRSSPIQVQTSYSQIKASCQNSYGIKTDGTLWAWGAGYVPNGTLDTISSPVQIGTLTDWASVFGCYSDPGSPRGWGFAINKGGKLYAWGANDNGQLGLGGGATSVISPTQVGTQTTWLTVGAGGVGSYFIR